MLATLPSKFHAVADALHSQDFQGAHFLSRLQSLHELNLVFRQIDKFRQEFELTLCEGSLQVADLHVAEHASANHFELLLPLVDFALNDFTRDVPLVGRDELLADKPAVLAGRAALSDIGAFVADDRILAKSHLDPATAGGFHFRMSAAQGRIVRHGQLL